MLTGPERRRRWSLEDRAQILAEAFAPGAVVSEVARRFEVSTGLIYTWRRQALVQQAEPALCASQAC
ncbi:transposase [Sinorhizobium fredii]|uniref:transposase n=1 Tax=Rhizobium fredii TaxID=380 RepID=UPI0002F8DA0A